MRISRLLGCDISSVLLAVRGSEFVSDRKPVTHDEEASVTQPFRIRAVFATILGLAVGLAPPASGLTVTPMSLSDVVESADCIVHGRIVAVHASRDDNRLPATWVTVLVERTLKGANESELTFKQFGGAADGAGARTLLDPFPHYAVDSEVVLFLAKPSRLGFTSPIGGGQGYYTIAAPLPVDAAQGTTSAYRMAPQQLDGFLKEVERLVGRR